MAAVLLGVPGAAYAHPHIFIDAGIGLIYDEAGSLVEVAVTWRYDELYSLLILQDYGLDPDFDGRLTEAERAETLGFDLNWGAGFEGGLEIWADGAAVALGTPVADQLELLESGQLETVHRRPVLTAVPASGAVMTSIYDPAFYIAFEMILPTSFVGRSGCEGVLLRADLDAAYARLDEELAAIGGAVAAEDNFPAVGAIFADRVEVQCAAE